MLKLCILLINFYQYFLSFDRGLLSVLAPGGACRYSPTCSEYTKQQLIRHGVIKGLWLGLKQIGRCR